MIAKTPYEFICLLISVVVSLGFHEYFHAMVAYSLGDTTTKKQGRLTLNPIKHLDVLGTIMGVMTTYGWPTPINVKGSSFEKGKKGKFITYISGSIGNIFLAWLFAYPLLYLCSYYKINSESLLEFPYSNTINVFSLKSFLFNISLYFTIVNVNMAVFNLLPMSPLDGFSIIANGNRYVFKSLIHYIRLAFFIFVLLCPHIIFYMLKPVTSTIFKGIFYIVKPLINVLA